ncbi:hypothetical protein ABFS83_14G247300 [Erythranthe nasuta]
MEKQTANDKILSYNDVVLRRSDLEILNGPYFLNDRIIEFYFSYLPSTFPEASEDILLLPPSITFWIKECPDSASLKDFIEPLHLPQRKLIIFPINDNDDVTAAGGGTHWSLLAFDRNTNLFVHHDSSGCLNKKHSKRVYKAVVAYTEIDAKYIECSSTPRQVNGFDCGLYVTAIARAICKWCASERRDYNMESLWFSTIEEQITPSLVSNMRNEILELVRNLMVKQENRVARK